MLKFIPIFLFYLSIITPVFSNEIKNQKTEISLLTGFAKYTTTDQLLNYFNFSGVNGIPFQINLKHTSENHIWNVEVFYHQSELKPINANMLLYDKNYINNYHFQFAIHYQYKLIRSKKYNFYVGVNSMLFSNLQKQHTYNKLVDVMNHRNSFDFSLLNFSPGCYFELPLKKHQFSLSAYYTLFNLAARPDDNFVKQYGYQSHFIWKTYFPKDYNGTELAIRYQWYFTDSLGIKIGYSLLYRHYLNSETYKYLQKFLFLGISKLL